MSSTSLSLQVKEDICAKIRSGEILPEEKFPPERKLAEQYGVSRGTIRKALVELNRANILRRVSGKGRIATNRPSLQDNTDRQQQHLVAVVVPNFKLSFFSEIVTGIHEYIVRRDFEILLRSANDDPWEERSCLSTLGRGAVEGLILVSGNYSLSNADILDGIRQRLSVVVVNQPIPALAVDQVHSGDRHGAFLLTSHFIELGHRRIAHLAAVEDRLEGYREALEEYHIEYDPGLVRFTHWTFNEGYSETKKLLFSNPGVTAIFACNDTVAAGVLKALNELGIKVPDDIGVAGYGNTDIAQLLEVPLTTVDQSPKEMGGAAARLLLEKLSGWRSPDENVELKFPAELVVRRSCGIRRPVRIFAREEVSRDRAESDKALVE